MMIREAIFLFPPTLSFFSVYIKTQVPFDSSVASTSFDLSNITILSFAVSSETKG
jgi:hypothetical protein